MHQKKGLFINFEGIDGSGKGTLMQLTEAWLRANGHDLVLAKEPGGVDPDNVLRTTIRTLLFTNPTTVSMAPNVVDCLMLADHVTNVETVIKPALAAGKTILSDRYAYSEFAYAVEREVQDDLYDAYEALVGPEPDINILLTGTPEHLLARAQSRVTETHQDGKAWNKVDSQRKIQAAYFRILGGQESTVVVDTDVLFPGDLFDRYILPALQKLTAARCRNPILRVTLPEETIIRALETPVN